MTLDVLADLLIARPREEVASYVMNPENDTAWIGGIKAARLVGEGPVAPGSRVARVAYFLGKRIEYVNEITELEPGSRLSMKSVVSPFPMQITYAFADDGTGTLTSVRVEGDASTMYRLFAPFLSFFVKRSISGDLRRLKRIMERP